MGLGKQYGFEALPSPVPEDPKEEVEETTPAPTHKWLSIRDEILAADPAVIAVKPGDQLVLDDEVIGVHTDYMVSRLSDWLGHVVLRNRQRGGWDVMAWDTIRMFIRDGHMQVMRLFTVTESNQTPAAM